MSNKNPSFAINTIDRRFTERKYLIQVLTANIISPDLSEAMRKGPLSKIVLSNHDAIKVNLHNNDLMVIIV